jgi:hypothetical protein
VEVLMRQLEVSKTKDYLLRNGKPFFYLADTVWAAFANLPLDRWGPYLRYRKMQGFNAIQISILPVAHDASTSVTNVDPFWRDQHGKWDVSRLNDGYFDRAEEMVQMAVDAGFVPVLGVLWKCYVPKTRACERSPENTGMSLEDMRAYVAYAVRRFKKYDPIFFISGDTEWNHDEEVTYYLEALEITKRECPDALLSMHLATGRDLPLIFEERVDFYMYQSGHGLEQKTPYLSAQKHYNSTIKRPVVNSEPCYEGHGKVNAPSRMRFDAFDMRKATWQSLLSGAKMGMAYGAHGVWSCHFDGMGFVNPSRKFVPYDWEVGVRLDGAWDVAYAKWIWEQYGLLDVEPSNRVVGDDDAVRLSVNADVSKVVLYTPCAYDIDVAMDLSGYDCTLIDLTNKRYTVPVVVTGEVSQIGMNMFHGDALFIAVKE